jgi:uncharacterized protein (TIGR00369 family)
VDSRPSSTAQLVADSFAQQDFMRTLGAELHEVGQGTVEIRLRVRPGLFQQDGFVHAGVVSAIADTAAGYAAMSARPEGSAVLTAEFKINLMAPARGAMLVARARVLRSGKRLTVAAADVYAQESDKETCVATLLGTIAHR